MPSKFYLEHLDIAREQQREEAAQRREAAVENGQTWTDFIAYEPPAFLEPPYFRVELDSLGTMKRKKPTNAERVAKRKEELNGRKVLQT